MNADSGTPTVATSGWPLWRRQVTSMLGLELRKTFLRGKAIPIWIVAFAPALLLLLRALIASRDSHVNPIGAVGMARSFAVVFQGFYLRGVVYFGCVMIFTYLFRGEVLEKSLHFYWLAPMRRSVFFVGKYVAGLLAAIAVFAGGVALQVLLAFLPGSTEGGRAYLLSGPGLGQLGAYLLTTALACAAYGAIFLCVSLYLRNPMIPAALLFGWEWLNFLLPPNLKRISVVHYLQSLCPVPVSEGPLALPAEPVPAWIAIAVLLALSAALVALGARRAGRIEIAYAGD